MFFIADLDDCCKVLTMKMKMPLHSRKDDVKCCSKKKCRFLIDRTTKVIIVISKPEKKSPLYADGRAVNPFLHGTPPFLKLHQKQK